MQLLNRHRYGCFSELGVLLVGVLVISILLFGVYVGALDCNVPDCSCLTGTDMSDSMPRTKSSLPRLGPRRLTVFTTPLHHQLKNLGGSVDDAPSNLQSFARLCRISERSAAQITRQNVTSLLLVKTPGVQKCPQG